ncbi:hypothetical protein H1C71_006455, partial [Ictidomys tridecemlineatus]
SCQPTGSSLSHSTPGEYTLAPIGPGPGFPLLQSREGIYRPGGIQTSVLQSTDPLTFLERKQTERHADVGLSLPDIHKCSLCDVAQAPSPYGFREARENKSCCVLQGPLTFVTGLLVF